MTVAADQRLISVLPEDLKFQLEPGKQSYCDLEVNNNTEHHVAFKVKTTSPKKYFVRPNMGILKPSDSSVIRVKLQAQRGSPPNMQCRDKFLIQSTIVQPDTSFDELPHQTFNNKDGEKSIEEFKMRVIYTAPQPNLNEKFNEGMDHILDANFKQGLQDLKEERDAAVRQTQQLLPDLDVKRQRNKESSGFSIKFALVLGFIGTAVAFLLNFLLSSSRSVK